jgi:hypothetical protein
MYGINNQHDHVFGCCMLQDNFGVTGPSDVSNRRILTQSFVHRTHIDIFGIYFAEPFKNWWSDDWLTKVYGNTNTLRDHSVTVRHQVSSEGQRYPVFITIPYHHIMCHVCILDPIYSMITCI